ncbi:hypothetical protein VV02_02265 [Luteipulveratus mongoliensis]|uniref:HTH luxR-type domain-containing protein n=1 Tax=Luteipulveratus mongoliensis TaxID=571913 RepID=A0A0K1JPB7_9MICO|nr:hypothetical protein VV02_02265 [Luteipulveratus mongoliensis]
MLETTVREARAGVGRAVLLSGAEGIGKSRLAAHVTGLGLDAGSVVLRGTPSGLGSQQSLAAISEALLSLQRRGGLPDLAEELGPYGTALAALIPDWARPGVKTDGPLVVLSEGLLRLLSHLAEESGVVLVIEDVHEADPDTLGVLQYLLRHLTGISIALILTTSPDRAVAEQLTRAGGRDLRLIELEPLDRDATEALAHQLADELGTPLSDDTVAQLWRDSGGVPFVIDELVRGVADGSSSSLLPSSVAQAMRRRVTSLGPQALEVLTVGALCGQRFPLLVPRMTLDLTDADVVAVIQAAVAAQILDPDTTSPDWYTFRSPLTTRALLAEVNATQAATMARRAARAVREAYGDHGPDSSMLAAELYQRAGEPDEGGRLLLGAGLSFVDRGAARLARPLLVQAQHLLAPTSVTEMAQLLRLLIPLLRDNGDLAAALATGPTIDRLYASGLAASDAARLKAEVAETAYVAGRYDDAQVSLDDARTLLTAATDESVRARIDIVAAQLELVRPNPTRVRAATEIAQRAAAAAERSGDIEVAVEAWEVRGILAREDDLDESIRCLDRAFELADTHRLPLPRASCQILRAGTTCLRDGDASALVSARESAWNAGAVTLAHEVDAVLAMQAVLHGDFDAGQELVTRTANVAERLELGRPRAYLMVVRATLHAHQGQRAPMESALDALMALDYSVAPELPLAKGLAQAVCSLLEEDADRARSEIAEARSLAMDNPSTFHLYGAHGMAILLSVLADRAGHDHVTSALAATPGRMRWNRAFLMAARAVLQGRSGDRPAAEADMAQALEDAAVFPVARHLILRLGAQEAATTSWGEPLEWARTAEGYFHELGVAPAAAACRRLMRDMGVSVQQRRDGAHLIPGDLRDVGITVREYDVIRVMVDRLSNREIGERLHISPRTVEKHISSALVKLGEADRAALIAIARAHAAESRSAYARARADPPAM